MRNKDNYVAAKELGMAQKQMIEQQIEKLGSLNGQVAYLEEALGSELEKWERKEYDECLKDVNEKLNDHKEHINHLIELKWIEEKVVIVHFDMDGVLVDYPEGVDNPESFGEMGPIEEMVDLYNELVNDNRYEVYLLSTAPWNNPQAWMDKRLWVEKYLGEGAHKRLCLTHNKQMVIGDYLIDDRPNNGAEDFQGEWIQYKRGQMTVQEIKNKINY
jgi:5'-nucleotidase